MNVEYDTGLDPCAADLDLAPFGIAATPGVQPFFCRVRVEDQHLSPTIEHVSNIEYVRWLDRAAELHADALGYTRKALLEHGMMWFVARHEIDYLAEAWRGDELVIATWVREFRRVKSWRDYAIVRLRDDALLCRASTLWVLVHLESRKPMRIPQEMIDRFTSGDFAATAY